MKLNGIDLSSIISPETSFIVTTYEFIESLADEFPAYLSLDVNNNVLRKLIIFDKPKLGFNFYPNYKYTVSVKKSSNTLYSLKGSDKILISIKAYKRIISGLKGLATKLYFLGIKNDKLYRLLILNDIPIIASNKDDLMNQLKEFLSNIYNIKISKLPSIIDGISYKERNDAKILDMDYSAPLTLL